MHHQGFPGDKLGCNSCRIGQPVMGMNDIKIVFIGDNGCNHCIIGNFLEEVLTVTAAEAEFA